MTQVELLYFDGCPSWKVADERLAKALRIAGRHDVVVTRRLVETVDDAEQTQFLGSPSIRIDGTDPFASDEARVGLACRVYAGPDGLSGSPTTAQFVEALS